MVPELVDGQDALQHHARLAVGEAGHHQARAVAQRHVSRQLKRLEMLRLARRLGDSHLLQHGAEVKGVVQQ